MEMNFQFSNVFNVTAWIVSEEKQPNIHSRGSKGETGTQRREYRIDIRGIENICEKGIISVE